MYYFTPFLHESDCLKCFLAICWVDSIWVLLVAVTHILDRKMILQINMATHIGLCCHFVCCYLANNSKETEQKRIVKVICGDEKLSNI